MRQQLVEELSKASPADVIGVITFDWTEEKRNLLIDGLIKDFVETAPVHKKQGSLQLEIE